jgi:dTDP-4-amino-4,6-dideoxygalactose transaminase
MKIPFSPPYIDEDVKLEVLHCLDSGWITSGPKVLALEKLVAEHVGIEQVVCCNSATSGLLLMLHWFGVGKGDEVIIPSYTYAATALVVMHAGATPVMLDCGPDFNLDVAKLRTRITPRTKAIIPVDVAGYPCEYDTIHSIVTSSEIRALFRHSTTRQAQLGRIMILSDAAHSIGAYYKGKRAGKLADFTVFSFHAVKNVTTAEGGAICINLPEPEFKHEDVYKQLKLWSLNGQTKDAFTKTQGGGWRYDIVYPGFKINMPDICAAIGLAQLRNYNSVILKERARVFESYSVAFESFPWSELPPAGSSEVKPSYHLYALRIKNITEDQRDKIIDHVTSEGVSVNVHFQPLPLFTIFKEKGYDIKDFPLAYDNYSREISLPIYPQLDNSKIAYIVQAVKTAYEHVVEAKCERIPDSNV